MCVCVCDFFALMWVKPCRQAKPMWARASHHIETVATACTRGHASIPLCGDNYSFVSLSIPYTLNGTAHVLPDRSHQPTAITSLERSFLYTCRLDAIHSNSNPNPSLRFIYGNSRWHGRSKGSGPHSHGKSQGDIKLHVDYVYGPCLHLNINSCWGGCQLAAERASREQFDWWLRLRCEYVETSNKEFASCVTVRSGRG